MGLNNTSRQLMRRLPPTETLKALKPTLPVRSLFPTKKSAPIATLGISTVRRLSGTGTKLVNLARPNKETCVLTKEAVLLGLRSLRESAAVFPPLQAALGVLFELVDVYDVCRTYSVVVTWD